MRYVHATLAVLAVLLFAGCGAQDEKPLVVPPPPNMTQQKANTIVAQINSNPKLNDAQKAAAIAGVKGMVGK